MPQKVKHDTKRKSDPATASMPSCIGAALFFLAPGAAVMLGYLKPMVPSLYLAASALTFMLYAFDKAAAKANRSRIPENVLHLLSLAGGWPGALVAQAIFRHKTRKQPFRIIFWISAALNVAAFLGWLFARGHF